MFLILWIFLVTYSIGIYYLIVFLVGLNIGVPDKPKTDRKTKISVIVPIYKEDRQIIKACLDSLLLQNPKRIRLYIVTKDVEQKNIQFIKRYQPHFASFRLLKQRKASLVKAYKLALRFVRTKYTCLVNVDATLMKNSIGKLVWFVENDKVDIGFGIVLPKSTTSFSKFTYIDKMIRQSLLQNGRGNLRMGNYIPGAFYIAETEVLKSELIESFTDDAALMLKAYSTNKIKLGCLRVPLAYELEKKSFISWTLQLSRWFVGNLKIYKLWMQALKNASMRIKIGIFGLIYIWYILPISIILGILSVVFFNLNVFVLLISYLALTALLYGINEIRKLNPIYTIGFWLIYSLAKFSGILVSVYTNFVASYINGKSYLLYKR